MIKSDKHAHQHPPLTPVLAPQAYMGTPSPLASHHEPTHTQAHPPSPPITHRQTWAQRRYTCTPKGTACARVRAYVRAIYPRTPSPSSPVAASALCSSPVAASALCTCPLCTCGPFLTCGSKCTRCRRQPMTLAKGLPFMMCRQYRKASRAHGSVTLRPACQRAPQPRAILTEGAATAAWAMSGSGGRQRRGKQGGRGPPEGMRKGRVRGGAPGSRLCVTSSCCRSSRPCTPSRWESKLQETSSVCRPLRWLKGSRDLRAQRGRSGSDGLQCCKRRHNRMS